MGDTKMKQFIETTVIVVSSILALGGVTMAFFAGGILGGVGALAACWLVVVMANSS